MAFIDPQSIPGLIFPIAAEGMDYVGHLMNIPSSARAVVSRGFNATGNGISTIVDFFQEYNETGQLGYAAKVAGVKLAWGATLESSLATVTGIDVQLLYPFGETNLDLISAADRADAFSIHHALMWCKNEQTLRSSLPTACYNFKSDILRDYKILASGTEEGHGMWTLYHRPDQMFYLETETSPHNPATHRLEVECFNLDILKIYVNEIFNINIPILL